MALCFLSSISITVGFWNPINEIITEYSVAITHSFSSYSL